MTPFQLDKYQKTLAYASTSLGIFLVEMTSFTFLSQHRDTQAIFYLLNKPEIKSIPVDRDVIVTFAN